MFSERHYAMRAVQAAQEFDGPQRRVLGWTPEEHRQVAEARKAEAARAWANAREACRAAIGTMQLGSEVDDGWLERAVAFADDVLADVDPDLLTVEQRPARRIWSER
jgi:hypothetical protein